MSRKCVDDFHIRVDLRGGIRTTVADEAAAAWYVGLTHIVDAAVDLRLEQLPSDGWEFCIDAVLQRMAPVLHELLQQGGELLQLADADGLFLLLLFQLGNALFGLKPGIPLGEGSTIALDDGV